MLKTTLWLFAVSTLLSSALTSTARAGDGFLQDLFSPRMDCVQFVAREEYIFMARDYRVESGDPAINGPDQSRLGFRDSGGASDLASGYRVGLGFQTPEYKVEAIFAEYGDWSHQASGSLTAGISFDGAPAATYPAGSNFLDAQTHFSALNTAATADADEADGLGPTLADADALPTYLQEYESSLQSLEINWMNNDERSAVRFGFGYRGASLDELARLTVAGSFRAAGAGDGSLSSAALTGAGLTFLNGTDDGFQEGTPDALTMSWVGDTRNQLNGFHGICDLCIFDTCKRGLSIVGKAGAFHNHARGQVSETYTGTGGNTSVYGRTLTDSNDVVSFMGSVALNGRRYLTPHIDIVFGYEVMFMSGLALAPEQVNGVRDGTYDIQTDGSIITHGGHVGLELTY